jgi:hypothetical protein
MAAPLTSAELAWVLIDEVLDPGSRHKGSIWEMLGLRVNASREEVEIRERHLRQQLHPDRLHQQGHVARYMMDKLQSDTNPLIEAMYVCVNIFID